MQASDFETLYKIEDAMETAVKTLFEQNSITGLRQRDADSAATPRATIQFTVGANTEHYHIFPNGETRPDIWSGSLSIGVVTDRTKNNSDHSSIRAKIRHLLYSFATTLNPILAYHSIMRVLESGTTPTVISDQNQDMSEINFTVNFCIRPDAWPAI